MPAPKRNRSPALLEGKPAIARYVNRSRSTVERWIAREGFPVGKLPDGTLAVTPGMIERWLMARGPNAPSRKSSTRNSRAPS